MGEQAVSSGKSEVASAVRVGLVGLFDILGYENLLERAEPERIAADVWPIVSGAAAQVPAYFRDSFRSALPAPAFGMMEAILGEIDWLVFSDTILMAVPAESESADRHTRWLLFLAAAVVLQNHLFSAGLPTRGAIDYGRYYLQGGCFAGRPIVEAYRTLHQLEFAACVLCASAEREFASIDRSPGQRLRDTYVTDYLAPMKGHDQRVLTVMAHCYASPDNMHRQVLRAFWAYGKDVPPYVQGKVANTVQWYESLLDKSDRRGQQPQEVESELRQTS